MRLKLLTTALLPVFSFVVAAQAPVDTLLQSSKARSISINYSPETITLNVKQINGTKDSFHYKYSTSKESFNEVTAIKCTDVSDVLVVSSDSALTVSFTDNVGYAVRNTFPLAAAPDRSIRSWTGDSEFGIGFPLRHSGKTTWSMISSGISFGFVTPTNASVAMQPSMGRSLEWTWNIILGVEAHRGRSTFQTGLGMRFRHMSTVAMHYFDKTEDGSICLTPYEEGAHDVKSGVHTFSLQIPVFYRLRFARSWAATIGPIVCFNTGGHLSTRYKIGDNEFEIKTHDIGQRPVTVDGMFAITVGGFGLYARYSPMNVLRDRAGIDFGTFSTGVIVAF